MKFPFENAVEVLLGGKPAGVGDLHGTSISEYAQVKTWKEAGETVCRRRESNRKRV